MILKLSELGAKLVIEGASTGYNLKFDGYNANFCRSILCSMGTATLFMLFS